MFRHILRRLLVAVCLVQVVVSQQRDHNGWQALEDKKYKHDNEYVPNELGGARQQVAKHLEVEQIKELDDVVYDDGYGSNSDYYYAYCDFAYDDIYGN